MITSRYNLPTRTSFYPKWWTLHSSFRWWHSPHQQSCVPHISNRDENIRPCTELILQQHCHSSKLHDKSNVGSRNYLIHAIGTLYSGTHVAVLESFSTQMAVRLWARAWGVSGAPGGAPPLCWPPATGSSVSSLHSPQPQPGWRSPTGLEIQLPLVLRSCLCVREDTTLWVTTPWPM